MNTMMEKTIQHYVDEVVVSVLVISLFYNCCVGVGRKKKNFLGASQSAEIKAMSYLGSQLQHFGDTLWAERPHRASLVLLCGSIGFLLLFSYRHLFHHVDCSLVVSLSLDVLIFPFFT
jgi:hypothetical protein